MMYNDFNNFIHEVKARANIRETAEFYGFKPNKSNKIRCPFHGEKTPSLHIYDKTNTFHCFGCGMGGDSVKFVSELYRLTPYRAAQKINIDMALNVQDSGSSATVPNPEEKKREDEIFSVWSDLNGIEPLCINAFDELPEGDNGDSLQKDLNNIRRLKNTAENFAKFGEEEDYRTLIEEHGTIEELKKRYPMKETKKEQTANNELFELILNAKDLTEEKIKTLKRILIDTNPYNADGTGKLNPVNLEKYLKEKNITIRYDDILHDLEIKGYDSSKIYTKDLFLNDCRYELEKYLKLCTPERLSGSLTSIAMKSHYNPILELIDNAEYNGKDCLQTAYEVLGIDDSAEYDDIRRSNNRISREILKTWLKQAYCMLHNGFCGEIFGLDFVLVLQGRQGKGKTSFFRKLALKREYFGEGMTLNVDDKDSLIKAVTKFIAELGEIESTFKRDKDKLKAFITNETDEYRKPYGQTYMTYPRLTSLCGTVNSVEFLTDDTGNRRYGVIPIDDSHDIIKHLDRLDPLQLWVQIREIVNNDLKNGKTYANCFRDRDLQVAVNARNTRFQKPIKGELEIKEIIESERAVADGDTRHKTEEVYMSASQFKDVHGDKTGNLSIPQIKAVFERLGIPQETGIKRTYDNTPLRHTYKVPYKRLI